MTRLLSGAALLLFTIAVVWLAPPLLLLLVAECVLLLAFSEYAGLAEASGLPIPSVASCAAAVLASIAVASHGGLALGFGVPVRVDVILVTAFIALAALTMTRWRGERDTLGRVAAAMLPSLYLALPVGAMVAIRVSHGPAALFLLILTVVGSDTAQYYTGRALGRRPLSPAISPKKTVEGALGGVFFGAVLLTVAGEWWLADVPRLLRLVLGLAVVVLGIAGDLFESMLKRSAGVKDSSTLIPGHGGVLDRIDALLFAAPVYYVVLTNW